MMRRQKKRENMLSRKIIDRDVLKLYIHREIDRKHTCYKKNRQTVIQTNIDRYDREKSRKKKKKKIEIQIDKKIVVQTDRKTGIQIDRQTFYRQTDVLQIGRQFIDRKTVYRQEDSLQIERQFTRTYKDSLHVHIKTAYRQKDSLHI